MKKIKTTKGFEWEEVGPGHWKDCATGLVWLPMEPGRYNWDQAKEKFGEALPTVDELQDFHAHGGWEVEMPEDVWWLWSSSSVSGAPYYAHVLDRDDGGRHDHDHRDNDAQSVRCVVRPRGAIKPDDSVISVEARLARIEERLDAIEKRLERAVKTAADANRYALSQRRC